MRRARPLADLRPGCFPAEGKRHPPHDHTKNRDGLTVRVIDPDQATNEPIPLLVDVWHENPMWENWTDGPIYELMTGNGYRVYTGRASVVFDLLALASTGHHAIHRWMQGDDTNTAIQRGKSQWQAYQRRLSYIPEPKPKADLDNLLSDISI